MRIGPLLAGKWLCFFPQVPTFQSGRDLTLGEVGSSNPNFDRRCQQDRRVERRVIIFLIMHDCFPLVGINAVISSWARRFFKMEKKRKMRRMKERHREKGKTPRKRSEKEQRTGGTDRIFFVLTVFEISKLQELNRLCPRAPRKWRQSRWAPGGEQCRAFISYANPASEQVPDQDSLPGIIWGSVYLHFGQKQWKIMMFVCLFLNMSVELNLTLSIPNSLRDSYERVKHWKPFEDHSSGREHSGCSWRVTWCI